MNRFKLLLISKLDPDKADKMVKLNALFKDLKKLENDILHTYKKINKGKYMKKIEVDYIPEDEMLIVFVDDKMILNLTREQGQDLAFRIGAALQDMDISKGLKISKEMGHA